MDPNRKIYLKYIDENIIDERYDQVDHDYLSFEVKMASDKDLERIFWLITEKIKFESNPYNSILLYITGVTDQFDFVKERSEMVGGAPPDIDIDHDALDREEAIQWCIDYWGKENVANIITHGTFKPKSLARSFYRITEGNNEDLNELLKKIPPPVYGKEATLEEILDIAPEVKEEERYANFLEFADRIEGMVSTFGIHAAGIIISDNEINDTVPIWKNSKADRITQYDKDECEELGLIKFDFLGIDTLSIIKECRKLIKDHTLQDIEPYAIEDGDEKTYKTLCSGLLTGVFQMETSGTAKKLILSILPKSIEDLSAISALNRPGPLQAGLDKEYVQNKYKGSPPKSLPSNVANVLESSYWTLVYQEQVMDICSKIAGFTPKEADDIRRAMGKKKHEVLEKYKEQFIIGCQEVGGLAKDYSVNLWDDLVGFADYCLYGSTKVITTNGIKTIKDIVDNFISAEVFSYSFKDKKLIKQKVSQWYNRGVKPVYKYTFEDGTYVVCTKDHKFLTFNDEMLEIDTIFNKNIKLKTK